MIMYIDWSRLEHCFSTKLRLYGLISVAKLFICSIKILSVTTEYSSSFEFTTLKYCYCCKHKNLRCKMISSGLHTCLIRAFLLYKRFSAHDLIAFEGTFNTYPHKRLNIAGHDVHRFRVASALQCSQWCLVQGKKCKGANFLEKHGADGLHACEIVFKRKSSNKEILQLSNLKHWICFNKVEFTERTEVNIIVYCTLRENLHIQKLSCNRLG